MKRILLLALALAALGSAGGCAMRSGVDLLKAPKPNKDNQVITDTLDELKSKDATEAAPYGGAYRSAVQMMDLDGDGVEEVIAFFQTPKGGNQYETILLGKQDEGYVHLGSIQGQGAQIQSVSYPALDGTGRLGVLICWEQMGDGQDQFTMAECTGDGVRTLLTGTYSNLLTIDLDSDGAQELFVFDAHSKERKAAQVYEYDGEAGQMTLSGEAPLTASAKAIHKVQTGYIAERQPAVFAEEKIEGGQGQQTDIFVYDASDGLRNLALETESGLGQGTYRPIAVNAYDVGGDGLTEIPRAVRMVGSSSSAGESAYMLDWYLYSAHAAPQYIKTTYRNVSQGWDFEISKSWHDAVRVVKGAENGAEYTSFVIYNPSGEDIPLLTIYYLLGSERVRTESDPDLISLGSTMSARIAAYIPSTAAGSSLALNEDQIKERFSLVAADWSAPQS